MALTQNLQIPYARIVAAATVAAGTLDTVHLIQFLEDEWVATYHDMGEHSPSIIKFDDHGFTFLYDQTSATGASVDDRLVVAHGLSSSNNHDRDKSRIRGFVGGGIEIPSKGTFDKGHALAHAMGGGLDANLFPQRPELNRGRSGAGRIYRRMEKYAALHAGSFVFSRLIYNNTSWVPSSLEYGVVMQDGSLWVELFEN